jgi:hypothetical protein
MVTFFSNIDLLLIFLSSIAYYGFGKHIIQDGFFSKILAGIVVSTLPVAIFMNINAQFAHTIQVSLFVLTAMLSLFYLYKKINQETFRTLIVKNIFSILLVIIGIIIVIINSPLNNYLSFTDNNIIFNYNLHDGYFASMMLELDIANYNDRLRIFDFYPAKWSTYHFFNIAALSTLTAGFGDISLFYFYGARLSIVVIFLLVSFELINQLKISKTKVLFIMSLYILLILSHYYTLFHWNFFTSGALSVIAILLFTFNLYGKESSSAASFETVFWLIIFSIATIRNVPIGLIGLFIYLFYNHKYLIAISTKYKIILLTTAILSFLYIILTILMGGIIDTIINILLKKINITLIFLALFFFIISLILLMAFYKKIFYFICNKINIVFSFLLIIIILILLSYYVDMNKIHLLSNNMHVGWMSVNVFYNGWGNFLHLFNYNYSVIDERTYTQESILSGLIWLPWMLIMLSLIYLYIKNRKIEKIEITLFILSTILMIVVYRFQIEHIMLWLIAIALPSIILLGIVQQHKIFTLGLVIVAILMHLILPANIGYPGFQVVEWMLLFVIIIEVSKLNNLKIISILLVLYASLYFSVYPIKSISNLLPQDKNDSTSVNIILNNSLLEKLKDENLDYTCLRDKKDIYFRSHAMITGTRIPFDYFTINNTSKRPLNQHSIEVMNTRFIPNREIKRLKGVNICKEK